MYCVARTGPVSISIVASIMSVADISVLRLAQRIMILGDRAIFDWQLSAQRFVVVATIYLIDVDAWRLELAMLLIVIVVMNIANN